MRPGPGRGSHLRAASALAAALAAALGVGLAPPARAQATLPTGFSDALVLGGLNNPVGIAFLPDGRLLFVEQITARVRLVVGGTLAAVDPVLTVPNVAGGGEQGLLGIAVDSRWPMRPYLYVQYDYSGSSTIRISRFTVGGDVFFAGNGALTVDPATRYDVLTDLPDQASNHNGGTLRFGPDNMLYSSLGDDANECASQDLTVLTGKILRLDVSHMPAGSGPPPKGLIAPANNPFVLNPSLNAGLVAFSGLRNPFRFAIDPVFGDLAIGDVGEVTQEEIDYVRSLGANFEWPLREGFAMGTISCSGVDMTYFTDPIHADDHGNRQAIIGGPIYRGDSGSPTTFGPGYEGDIFYSDYYLGYLRRLKRMGNTWDYATPVSGQPNATDWATGLVHVSDYLVNTDGSLWYCKQSNASFQANSGQVRRIYSTVPAGVGPEGSFAGPRLFAPAPSPARASASLAFELDRSARVTLALYDLGGRRVRSLLAGAMRPAGVQSEVWDGRADDGSDAPAGVYFARLDVDGQRFERRFALIR